MNFLLTIGTVDTMTRCSVAVIIGVNFSRRDDRNMMTSCPGHHPADIRQNPSVVPDARFAADQEKIFLCIDVYQDLFSSCSD
jgi:hypothetical protein